MNGFELHEDAPALLVTPHPEGPLVVDATPAAIRLFSRKEPLGLSEQAGSAKHGERGDDATTPPDPSATQWRPRPLVETLRRAGASSDAEAGANLVERCEASGACSGVVRLHGRLWTIFAMPLQANLAGEKRLLFCLSETQSVDAIVSTLEDDGFYRALFEESRDIMLIYDRASRRILDANRAAELLLGYTREEILALTPQQLLFWSSNSGAREVDDLVNFPQEMRSDVGALEIYRRKDSSIFPVEVVFTQPSLKLDEAYVISARDVSARREAEKALENSERRFRILVENTSDVFWRVDADFLLQYVSPAITQLLGYPPAALKGISLFELMNNRHAESLRQRCLERLSEPAFSGEETVVMEAQTYRQDGRAVWCEVVSMPVRDDFGEVIGWQGVTRDISQRKHREEMLMRQAYEDELTKLCNRRRFRELGRQEEERVRRYGRDISLILLDIDHFKKVNDAFGHDAGDMVLKAVAETLKRSVRGADVVGRLGGEEFCVLLPETDLESARLVAEKLRKYVAVLKVDIGYKTLAVTVSLGVAHAKGEEARLESLLKQSDEALYAAKRGGRNRTVTFSPAVRT